MLSQQEYNRRSLKRIRARARAFDVIREYARVTKNYELMEKLDNAYDAEVAKCNDDTLTTTDDKQQI